MIKATDFLKVQKEVLEESDLDMKRQQAPKPEAQLPSLRPPLSEHSRGERHTPVLIKCFIKSRFVF